MKRFWPVSEAAQADYERLRETVLFTGALPDDLASARFHRRGLGGLIAWPEAEPVFWVELLGASRPAWTPYVDPRMEALAASYGLLVAKADEQTAWGVSRMVGRLEGALR